MKHDIVHLMRILTLGIVFGFLVSLVFLRIFPEVELFTREYMPLEDMLKIFVKNCFLATLICYGGIIFSLVEIKFSKFSRAYELIDKTLDPIYFILRKISEDYKKLGRLYRSLYLCLSTFSIVCIFLIGFVISFYFSIFFLLTEIGVRLLFKSIPHLFLETTVFIISAWVSLEMSKKLVKYIIKKAVRRFEKECIKFLKSREIWIKLSVLYVILFLSAIIEKFSISL
ncbi:MAG: stage II sporulation protein M [Candidatus Aenigmarchaeota archaeon]|nr:stage II sporulation protein M [Candidatus Aenigmarchaeota archaeon]